MYNILEIILDYLNDVLDLHENDIEFKLPSKTKISKIKLFLITKETIIKVETCYNIIKESNKNNPFITNICESILIELKRYQDYHDTNYKLWNEKIAVIKKWKPKETKITLRGDSLQELVEFTKALLILSKMKEEK